MTGTRGAMLIREGQYALALLPGQATVQNLRLNYRVEIRGDLLPGALSLLLADMILLSAGKQCPGLKAASVLEES